jgi:hypothetical protein
VGFVPAGSAGLRAPSGMVYGPDGKGDGRFDLYLADQTANGFIKSGVKRYDGVTGAYIDEFVPERSSNLEGAVMIAFTETDPVTLAYTGAGPTPAVLGSALAGARGSTIRPGNDVYVAEGVADRIARIDMRAGVAALAGGLPVGPFGGLTSVAFSAGIAYPPGTDAGPDVGRPDAVGRYQLDDRPTGVTVTADTGAWSAAKPSGTPVELATRIHFSLEPVRGGPLVSDRHHDRVLQVEIDGDVS